MVDEVAHFFFVRDVVFVFLIKVLETKCKFLFRVGMINEATKVQFNCLRDNETDFMKLFLKECLRSVECIFLFA